MNEYDAIEQAYKNGYADAIKSLKQGTTEKREKYLLVVVDPQNDFIDGSLGTPEAQAVVPRIADKINRAVEDECPILYTIDVHNSNYLNTHEGHCLPIQHCVSRQGTLINPSIASALSNSKLHNYKLIKNQIVDAELVSTILDSFNVDKLDRIIIIGYCLDICVLANAILLKSHFGSKVMVDVSCCAASKPGNRQHAIEILKACQIDLI